MCGGCCCCIVCVCVHAWLTCLVLCRQLVTVFPTTVPLLFPFLNQNTITIIVGMRAHHPRQERDTKSNKNTKTIRNETTGASNSVENGQDTIVCRLERDVGGTRVRFFRPLAPEKSPHVEPRIRTGSKQVMTIGRSGWSCVKCCYECFMFYMYDPNARGNKRSVLKSVTVDR